MTTDVPVWLPIDPQVGRCSRGCCWTLYGHSTVRDIYPPDDPRSCHCHDAPKEAA